tara:strand:- start:2142 stop:2318 length:177 start_codon:yes stop_codon:yes gene_type:complete
MIINDIYGNPFKIKDIKNFKYHIKKYHAIDGIPDNSLHEEEGFYFRVDEKFYNQLFGE